jgi:hypothetical protein
VEAVEVAAFSLPSWLRIPSESAASVLGVEVEAECVGPDAGPPDCPLSDPRDGRVAGDSSFAHSKELDDPYSHSEWRLAQLEQDGRPSSHCDA